MKKDIVALLPFKVQLQGKCERFHVSRVCSQVSKLVSVWEIKKAGMALSRMNDMGCQNCYVYRLLRDKFLSRRNASGDCESALADMKSILVDLKKYVRGSACLSFRETRHLHAFQAEVMEELAKCLYYMERDKECLRICREMLSFAREKSLRIEHLKDIENRMSSLEFMLSPCGCVRARQCMCVGHFDKALAIVNAAISIFGIDNLDHEALTMVAVCNAAVGDFRKAKSMMDIDYRYSSECLETRFFWALMNLGGARMRASLRIIREISRGNDVSSCKIDAVRRLRIRRVAKLVASSKVTSRRLMVDMGAGEFKCMCNREFLRAAIWFIMTGRPLAICA